MEIIVYVMPSRGQPGLRLNFYLQPSDWDEDLEGSSPRRANRDISATAVPSCTLGSHC